MPRALLHRRDLPRTGSRARRAFTLIELLAVILIISILAVALVPNIVDAFDTAEVRACQENLSEIYQGIIVYKQKFDRIPDDSGPRFFAQLISRGALTNNKQNAERMTCPAVDKGFLTIGTMDPQEWWDDLEEVDGTFTAYAGRDTRNHPLKKLPADGTEPIVADDNDGGMNHSTTTNVLYDGGTVETFEIALLREEGLLGPEEEVLVVGPESPVEDLRKLALD